jgi:hypothetical protein
MPKTCGGSLGTSLNNSPAISRATKNLEEKDVSRTDVCSEHEKSPRLARVRTLFAT